MIFKKNMKLSTLNDIKIFKRKSKKKIFLLTGYNSFRKTKANQILKYKIGFESIYKKSFYPEIKELRNSNSIRILIHILF